MTLKRLAIIVFILIFTGITIYIFKPITFSKDFFNSDSITISYVTDNTNDNGTIIPNMKNITFPSDSNKFHELELIFEKYSYHYCINTWTGKALSDNTTSAFLLSSNDKTIIISNAPHIIIDDKVYRVGYWGNVKINKLISELKDLLSN